MLRVATGLVLIGLASVARAAPRCERTPLDAYVESGRDLLIGEATHGVVETPALLRCLVLTAMARVDAEPLVVSLEFTPAARDLSGETWKSNDGRSSIAMWELVRFLFEQEEQGKLAVAFHQPVLGPVEGGNAPDLAAGERQMGHQRRELAEKNLLIGLVGNAHSRKTRPDWLPYEPAGAYMGDAVLSVAVEAVQAGTAWNQVDGRYESRAMGGGQFAGQEPGTLVDGRILGHDLVYLVPRFTASGPKYP